DVIPRECSAALSSLASLGMTEAALSTTHPGAGLTAVCPPPRLRVPRRLAARAEKKRGQSGCSLGHRPRASMERPPARDDRRLPLPLALDPRLRPLRGRADPGLGRAEPDRLRRRPAAPLRRPAELRRRLH